MHDIRRIRDNADEVQSAIRRKGFKPDMDQVLELDRKWRDNVIEGDRLKAELNTASKAIGMAKKAGKDAADEMEAARRLRERIAGIDEIKKDIQEQLRSILITWPAEPDPDVPDGLVETGNVIVRDVGEIRDPDFKIIDHLALAEGLGILDMGRGAKVTGSAFPVYVGLGAQLERALINFMLDLHVREHGYREVFIPFVVNEQSAFGTGQIPKLVDDMYRIENEGYYLIPTAEVPITNLHRDEILPFETLPVKYTAYSACFRREAGAYGADTRGLLRVHQFNKVELVQIVEPSKSEQAHEEILEQAVKVLDLLEIPYRVVELCAGELSFAAAKCYDIEVWSPATKGWLECSSVSNFRDFQAKRMNLRYRPDGKGKPAPPHTLNGSGLATSRLMVSLLENYQTPEKRVRIPRVLQPYLGGIDQIKGVSK